MIKPNGWLEYLVVLGVGIQNIDTFAVPDVKGDRFGGLGIPGTARILAILEPESDLPLVTNQVGVQRLPTITAGKLTGLVVRVINLGAQPAQGDARLYVAILNLANPGL